MNSSPSIDMSLFGVIAIGLIVAFVAAAIVRPPLGKNLLHWLCAVGLLVVATLFGVRFLAGYNSLREHEARQAQAAQAAFERMEETRSHMQSYGDATSSVAMAEYQGPARTWSETRVHTTKSWGVLFIALFVPFIIFLVARLVRRAARGDSDTSRSSSPWSWLAAGLACFLILGGWFGARKTVHMSGSPMPVDAAPVEIGGHDLRDTVTQTQPTRYTGQVPIDELWERLNASQIPVTTSMTSDLARTDESQDGGSDSEHSSGTEADHGDAASHAVVDDPFAAEETTSKSKRLDKLYEKVSNDDDAPPFKGSETKTAPAPRPDWINEQRNLVINGVRRVVIEAGPYTQLQECHEALRQEMVKAVQSHLHALVLERTHDPLASMPPIDLLGIGENYITREFLVDQFVEDGEASFGLTKTAWGLLEFSENADANLYNAWRAYARRSRIATIVMLAGVAVSTLGGIFALLKIDTWTRGYYTKRLFLGVPAAIMAFIVAFMCVIAVVG